MLQDQFDACQNILAVFYMNQQKFMIGRNFLLKDSYLRQKCYSSTVLFYLGGIVSCGQIRFMNEEMERV